MRPKFLRAIRGASSALSAALLFSHAVPAATTHGIPTPREAPRPAAAPPAPDVLSDVRGAIAAREYEATQTASGLQAPNRAHGLRTYFDADGARVVDRVDASRELAHLRTVAVGREGAPARTSRGAVRAEGARVEVRRPGVVEWYENSERGLEQGWTLDARPEGAGALAIEVDFGTEVRVDGGRASIVGEGRRLEYGGLEAHDARGAALEVRMERAATGRVRILVDDAEAAYPIMVDPTLTEPTTLTGDQTDAGMGSSVAGAGDVNGDGYDDVIVGADGYDAGQMNEGAAFVFLGSASGIASGNPSTAATILQSDQVFAAMGSSVAGAGDVNGDGYDDVVVGADGYDAGETDEGAAFVFLGSASGIASGNPSTAATILQADQELANLGDFAAGAGDVNGDGYDDVVVGAPFYDAGEADEGAAFVFLGSASGIASGNPSTAATILQADQLGADLGISVAGAGDVNGDGYDDVVVGALSYDAGETSEGAAFVFLGSASGIASGNPSTAATILQADQLGADLGISVAGAGDVNGDGYDDVVVGADGYDAGEFGEGAAFVFLGSASGIASGNPSTAATILQADQTNAFMGSSVAGAGDVNGDRTPDVVVGAPFYDAGETNEGAAFVFLSPAVAVACQIVCPANVAVPNDASTCGAVVKYAAPTTTGDCGAVTCVPGSGSLFAVGTTTVTCTAADPKGRRGAGVTCSFTVTVTDAQPPTIACPANVTTGTQAGQCSAVVTYATPTATDTCAGATVACVPASGSTFPTGTTTVTCTAADASSNTSTCSFTVTVADTTAPTIACPPDVTTAPNTVQGTAPGALVAYPAPTATDNCSGLGAPVCSPASGSFFPTGTTTVTCTVSDASANAASCSFTVTVTTAFTNCYVDDATGDTFSIDTAPSSPLYRLWQYRVAATGQIIAGSAEGLAYIANRSLVAYDRDNPTARMDANFNLGSRTGTATVTDLTTGVRHVLRDRNTANDPRCR